MTRRATHADAETKGIEGNWEPRMQMQLRTKESMLKFSREL